MDEAVEGCHFGVSSIRARSAAPVRACLSRRKIYDEFVEKSVARARRRTVGNPFDAGTEQGPQIDGIQFDKVMSYIDSGKDEGANC